MKLLLAFALASVLAARASAAPPVSREIEGWTVHVSAALQRDEAPATEKALVLLQRQLAEIARVVPAPAVARLREVPLWISPEYPGIAPRAEYHPDRRWLIAHGRDPAMAKGIEFTNVRIFEQESRRMPNFALHELAHAYHDRVLGFRNAEIKTAYERASAAQLYAKVERWHGDGRPITRERAYAMENEREYFAETTEACFSRNDFFPFNREDLLRHDPEMARLLERLWNPAPPGAP